MLMAISENSLSLWLAARRCCASRRNLQAAAIQLALLPDSDKHRSMSGQGRPCSFFICGDGLVGPARRFLVCQVAVNRLMCDEGIVDSSEMQFKISLFEQLQHKQARNEQKLRSLTH
ncbi:hypothetical protein [Burkholderia cepacia]|uniref:hypothetical protein n=1 Tax=Burkholderia cepacia TaxID=292 RepID=UPI002ABE8A0D|nr:hypothetical protein [Burkholderia cepacia]